MPIYEYRCEAGHQFEVMQRISDAPLTTCQTCEAPAQKLISSTSFILKGSGWYVTDYAKKNISPKSESTSEAKADAPAAEAKAPAASPAPSTGGGGASGSSS